MSVELIHLLRDQQWRWQGDYRPGMTARELVERSGVLKVFPELNAADLRLGIFGQCCEADSPLRDGDRVEIYRPLINDPKKARRQRAAGR